MSFVLPVLLIGIFLAYANGANDNFKGVATLYGSGTTTYKKALAWATFTTLLGSLAAVLLAKGLIVAFSGKGLVPNHILELKSFPLAVGLAAATTVMLATRFGFPISTTHSLVGSLIGAGFAAMGAGIHLDQVLGTFFLPLLISPVLAIFGAIALYPLIKKVGQFLNITKENCLCVGTKVLGVVPQGISAEQALMTVTSGIEVTVGTKAQCVERYQGHVFGIDVGSLLDALHYLSAGAVSFARGLNDTPKIVAILLVSGTFNPLLAMTLVGLVIGVGGILHAKKVAETMSHDITEMNHAEGLLANLVTSFLVIFASRFGMPVSTTHVSCGALFGIGAATSKARLKTISGIIASWLITLPVAMILSGVFFLLLREVLA
ncbi:MAG TPA: inorganic phosphate transporter [Deltaproteobacteria bacterium]|nr:inorganic phosphate transporter [Deltaproteobacteria bacterium]